MSVVSTTVCEWKPWHGIETYDLYLLLFLAFKLVIRANAEDGFASQLASV